MKMKRKHFEYAKRIVDCLWANDEEGTEKVKNEILDNPNITLDDVNEIGSISLWLSKRRAGRRVRYLEYNMGKYLFLTIANAAQLSWLMIISISCDLPVLSSVA